MIGSAGNEQDGAGLEPPAVVRSICVPAPGVPVEVVEPGELYYWPPGHTIRAEGQTRYVEFSPSEPMGQVLDHVVSKL